MDSWLTHAVRLLRRQPSEQELAAAAWACSVRASTHATRTLRLQQQLGGAAPALRAVDALHEAQRGRALRPAARR